MEHMTSCSAGEESQGNRHDQKTDAIAGNNISFGSNAFQYREDGDASASTSTDAPDSASALCATPTVASGGSTFAKNKKITFSLQDAPAGRNRDGTEEIDNENEGSSGVDFGAAFASEEIPSGAAGRSTGEGRGSIARLFSIVRRMPSSSSWDDESDDGKNDSKRNDHVNDSNSNNSGDDGGSVLRTGCHDSCHKYPKKEDSGESDKEEKDGSASCAICFLSIQNKPKRNDENVDPSAGGGTRNEKWRELVVLPCCGSDGKEQTSSTRFCASCIFKIAKHKANNQDNNDDEYEQSESERSNAPHSYFYDAKVTTGGFAEDRAKERLIECPRCRELIVVTVQGGSGAFPSKSDSESLHVVQRKKDQEELRSISLKRAPFPFAVRFAGRKRGMAPLLYACAFLHHSFLPLAVLGGESSKDNIAKLCRWGILHRTLKDGVYAIELENQIELQRLFQFHSTTSDNSGGHDESLFAQVRELAWLSFWGVGCRSTTSDNGGLHDESEGQRDEDRSCMISLCGQVLEAAHDSVLEGHFVTFFRLTNRIVALALCILGFPPLALLTSAWMGWFIATLNIFCFWMFLPLAVMYAVFSGVGWFVTSLLSADRRSWWWQTVALYVVYCVAKTLYSSSWTMDGLLWHLPCSDASH